MNVVQPINKHFLRKGLPVSEIVVAESNIYGAFCLFLLKREFFNDITLIVL